MIIRFLTAAFISFVIAGCASVPMETAELTEEARLFKAPEEGYAGLYIYRDSFMGKALKKDIWVNDKCVGESAANVFFYEEYPGDQEYLISTESEFSPNSIKLLLEAGKNYFVRQYIKIGLLVGGADLEVEDQEVGKAAISKLNRAKVGFCSQTFPQEKGDDTIE